MQKIIGIYSPAPQSGKSTVAEFLGQKGYAIVPFAETLKEMLVPMLQALGYDNAGAHYLTHEAKEIIVGDAGVSVRHMLQTLGTEWGRSCIHPEIWLRCWRKKMAKYDAVVADDVRFLNEAKLVKLLGGEVWRIDRFDDIKSSSHSSEGSLDDYNQFDRLIKNDGTFDDLICKLRETPM